MLDKDFFERRIKEAAFHCGIFQRYCEKMPDDFLLLNLKDKYRKKYEQLKKEYLSQFAEESDCAVSDNINYSDY